MKSVASTGRLNKQAWAQSAKITTVPQETQVSSVVHELLPKRFWGMLETESPDVFLCKLETATRAAKMEKSECFWDM